MRKRNWKIVSSALNIFPLVDNDAFFQSVPLLLLTGKQYTILYLTAVLRGKRVTRIGIGEINNVSMDCVFYHLYYLRLRKVLLNFIKLSQIFLQVQISQDFFCK